MAAPQTALSTAGPEAIELYEQLKQVIKREVGDFKAEVKKTSIHLNRKTAFAGVQLRKSHLILTIKSEKQIKDSRIARSEQTSASRWHNEAKIASSKDLDSKLIKWLKAAYELSA
jgi:predicted transport protein